MENYLCMNEQESYNYNTYRSGVFYRDQVSNLLCVTWDNSRDMGEFYIMPAETNNEQVLKQLYDNWKSIYIPESPVNSATTYIYGEYVRIIENENEEKNFFWYQSDPYGYCVRTYGVKFLIPNKKISCKANKCISVSDFRKLKIKATNTNKDLNTSDSKIYSRNKENKLVTIEGSFNTCYIESLKLYFYTSSDNTDIDSINYTIICIPNTPSKCIMTFETKWLTIDAKIAPEFKSGNPGYYDKKPVLFLVSNTLYENGIFIRGSDKSGNCLQDEDNQANYFNSYDESIRFGVDSIYICTIPLNDAFVLTYEKHINNIGRFGSSDPTKINDWNEITIEQDDTQENTYILQILTSKFGPKSKPQQYILGSKLLKPTILTSGSFRFITKFIPVSYDQFSKSNTETSLPPFPDSITNTIG